MRTQEVWHAGNNQRRRRKHEQARGSRLFGPYEEEQGRQEQAQTGLGADRILNERKVWIRETGSQSPGPALPSSLLPSEFSPDDTWNFKRGHTLMSLTSRWRNRDRMARRSFIEGCCRPSGGSVRCGSSLRRLFLLFTHPQHPPSILSLLVGRQNIPCLLRPLIRDQCLVERPRRNGPLHNP